MRAHRAICAVPRRREWVVLCSPASEGGRRRARRPRRGRGPRGQAQLGEHVAEVAGDRLLADEQLRGDLAVGEPARDVDEHLGLAGRQGRFVPADRWWPRGIGVGAEVVQRRTGRIELHLGAVGVPQPGTRVGGEQPHPRRVVRRAEVVPQPPRSPELLQGLGRLALGEHDRSFPGRRGGPHQLATELASDPGQLVRAGPRVGQLTRGQRDLDVRRERAGSFDLTAGLVDQPPDRPGGRCHVSLRQPQEREAGLRVAAGPGRPSVGRLRSLVLAAEPVQLAALVPRVAHRRRPVEPEARGLRGGGRLRPRTSHPQHLGAVDQALAAVRDQVGVGVAPRAQREDPLLGAGDLEQPLAGDDRPAGDQPRGLRRERVGLDGDHRLVHEGHTAVPVAELDQRLAPTEPADGGHVGVGVPLTQLHHLDEPLECRRGIAGLEQAQRHRCQQQAAFGTVEVAEQLVGAGQPARPSAGPALVHQAEPQPERAAGRGRTGTGVHASVDGPGGPVVPAVGPGEVGEGGQAAPLLDAVRLRGHEAVEGLTPRGCRPGAGLHLCSLPETCPPGQGERGPAAGVTGAPGTFALPGQDLPREVQE